MLASADDSVADMIPAIVIGATTETSCITWKWMHNYERTLHIHVFFNEPLGYVLTQTV